MSCYGLDECGWGVPRFLCPMLLFLSSLAITWEEKWYLYNRFVITLSLILTLYFYFSLFRFGFRVNNVMLMLTTRASVSSWAKVRSDGHGASDGGWCWGWGGCGWWPAATTTTEACAGARAWVSWGLSRWPTRHYHADEVPCSCGHEGVCGRGTY